MGEKVVGVPRGLRILLLISRVPASVIVFILVSMMISYAVNAKGDWGADYNKIFLLTFFPIGMCFGYIVAWRWVLAGGIISTVSIVIFLAALGEIDMVGIVGVLGIPGVLFIVYGLSSRRYLAKEA